MGRLFWKLFLSFLLAGLLAGGLMALAFSLLRGQAGGQGRPPPSPRFATEVIHQIVVSGETEAAARVLAGWRARGGAVPLVLAPDGHELLGRTVSDEQRADGIPVQLADGLWTVVSPSRDARPPRADGGPPVEGLPPPPRGLPMPPPPVMEIVGLLIAALATSAGLAAYLARPARHLSRAFDAIASGDLSVRTAPLMGRRRDEIADLGRGFDRMAERLQSLLGAQRSLLHDVSHELRSPLARMAAAIGLARQDPARRDEMFERVERDMMQLDALVGELLGLSRLEHDAEHTVSQPVCVADVLRERVDDARFEAAARLIALELSIAPAASTGSVTGHRALIARAIDNVLRNAIKFSPDRGTVTVALLSAGDTLHLSVRDHGPGVPTVALQRIFDPFVRIQPSTRDGTGLGLSISRRAVEAHGGRITACLPAGGGLQIDILLRTDA
ncbi:HAMP domain-containing sensor histidine kinase [Methyloversatilis thermotolerans]|uniref:HAMP domain-containing sensor histidine kinase n=1 Tax=Methyloversatilis thermotolerans TaxID=1346290 RepID=UPI000363828D|nr:ATP-binding protein [Methyloversatilis thermotolerans]